MPQLAPANQLPSSMRAALVDLVEGGDLVLPMLPDVTNHVISACFEADCNMEYLASIIERDQFMAAHLLRWSNSALYSPPSPVTSLHQALSMLGINKIRNLALLISVESRVFQVPGFEEWMASLLRHSMATAALAKEIGRRLHMRSEELFLCGLLHDLGKPVLLQTIVDLRVRMGIKARRKIGLTREAIEEAVNEFHCAAGARLMSSWNMPDHLAEVVACHHNPRELEHESPPAHVIHLADDLAHLDDEASHVTEEDIHHHSSARTLGMSPSLLNEILEQREEIMTSMQIGT